MAVKLKRAGQSLEGSPAAHIAAEAAAAHKALDIRAYDLEGVSLLADTFVMCSVSSEPHMRAVTRAVYDAMHEHGVKSLHEEGSPSDRWVVLDFGICIFHCFREDARSFYDLDGLWADARQIAVVSN